MEEISIEKEKLIASIAKEEARLQNALAVANQAQGAVGALKAILNGPPEESQ